MSDSTERTYGGKAMKRDPLWHLALALLFGIHARVVEPDTLIQILLYAGSMAASALMLLTFTVIQWRGKP